MLKKTHIERTIQSFTINGRTKRDDEMITKSKPDFNNKKKAS